MALGIIAWDANRFHLHSENGRVILIDRQENKAWVNQLEFAQWCEISQSLASDYFTITKRLPEALKLALGKDSFTITRIENPDSPEPWSLISTDEAFDGVGYFAYDAKGSTKRTKAKTLFRAMGKAGAFVYACGKAGINVQTQTPDRPLTRDEIRSLLIVEEPTVWAPRFREAFYAELSRLTGLVQYGNARPKRWAQLTLELFYDYLPGELTIILKQVKGKHGDWLKLHQFLSEDGRKVFAVHMSHLLQTMKDADSINDVRRALRRHYGKIDQMEIFLDNRKDGVLTMRRNLVYGDDANAN